MNNDSRLYLITPPQLPDLRAFCDDFTAALDAGDVACIQLRLKAGDGSAVTDDDVLYAAEAIMPIAQEREVAFIINDRPDLALKTGADGVHVGQSDASCKKARAVLGDDATVGVTCHESKHFALVAGEDGADYVAFGAFFPTTTKETEFKAEIGLLEWWSYATTLPSVAIGGITPENCRPIVRAGADFLAVSGAVWNHPEGPGAAIKAFEMSISEA
ncbi:thiamine phosphate synthase [Hyphococcus lacteus]|uniref:Thiamine-phosphate synthase n=1 Tax=Hyphococcus lacteus TaxID=3143536 RepID=A0ABV3Z324_9PROT